MKKYLKKGSEERKPENLGEINVWVETGGLS